MLLAGIGAACGGDGGTKYVVTVRFNETVTQADMDAVAAFLRDAYDDEVDFLIHESFPPTGVAYVETDDEGFCAAMESALAKSYVEGVMCAERGEEIPVESPDAPFTYP